ADLAALMGFGDATGAKLGTLKTYLQDAADAGARFVVDCAVTRVLVEDGRAAGVEGTYLDEEGRRASVVVRAPTVVLAAGALDTPAVLLRSGIGGPAAGDYLRLHPATAMPAVYDEPQKAWWGPPQTALSAQFADLEDGYGFLIETAHASPAVTGSSVPWVTGQQHKEYMAQAARHARRVDRRCERVPERVRHEPDDHDHGARPPNRRQHPALMPTFKHEGHRLAYTSFGSGPRTCVLIHGLLLSQKMHRP